MYNIKRENSPNKSISEKKPHNTLIWMSKLLFYTPSLHKNSNTILHKQANPLPYKCFFHLHDEEGWEVVEVIINFIYRLGKMNQK